MTEATIRGGRSNRKCLADIFGENSVPSNATEFHTQDDLAVFLDARGPDWSTPIATIHITPEIRSRLRAVGMSGSFGWHIGSTP